jgi:hypothetical protein
VALVAAACAPDTDTRELLLAMQAQNQAMQAQSKLLQQQLDRPSLQNAPAELVTTAMAPMQEVLVELGKTQRTLSERQATLTREMRQWTRLLVESRDAQQSEEAVALAARLEALEKTIQEQDQRHREVEELMGTALTRTADQLQKFLERLNRVQPAPAGGERQPETGRSEAGNPETGNPESGNPAADKSDAGKSDAGKSNAGKPEVAEPGEGAQRATGEQGGNEREQQASMWPLWGVALLAIASGIWLLLPGRRRPVAIAPEMQVPVDDQDVADAVAPEEALSDPAPASTDEGVDEPEVEELWTAAALLGEAIGRIKQSGGTVPAQLQAAFAPPSMPAEPAPAESLEPPQPTFAESGGWGSEPTAPPAAPAASPRDDDPQPSAPEVPSEHEVDLDDYFVIDEHDEVEDDFFARGSDVPPPPPIEPQPAAPPVRPSVSEPPVAVPRPDSITCRLPADDVAAAAGQILDLLGADPRVLVQPAPRVERRSDAVEVSFSLLPDLPAGERALLEQRLRDASF